MNFQEMDNNNNTKSKKNEDEKKAAEAKRDRDKFQSEISEKVKQHVKELSAEFDSKLDQKLKEGTVDEKEFRELKDDIQQSLKDVQSMVIEMKSKDVVMSEDNIEKVLSKLMKKAENEAPANGAQSSGTEMTPRGSSKGSRTTLQCLLSLGKMPEKSFLVEDFP